MQCFLGGHHRPCLRSGPHQGDQPCGPRTVISAVTAPRTAGFQGGDCGDDYVLDKCRALVLDVSCRPVSVVGWKRALCLDILEKVEVLEYYDITVRSVSCSYPLPAVIRASFVLQNFNLEVPVSKRNILIRDNHMCVYCGSTRELTMDHVIPVSKGGQKVWENVVTACVKCNGKKGDRTLKQMGWKLGKTPKAPPVPSLKYSKVMNKGLPLLEDSEWGEYAAKMMEF